MTKSITKKICEEHNEEDLRKVRRRRSAESKTKKICEKHNEEDLRRAKRRRFTFLIRSQHLMMITSTVKGISYDVEILYE